MTPLFQDRADKTLSRIAATYSGRGEEYGDTWRNARFLILRAVSKQLGYEIREEHLRALATAAFCDMKYERMAGGYKDDHLIDGGAYGAFLAEEMQSLKT